MNINKRILVLMVFFVFSSVSVSALDLGVGIDFQPSLTDATYVVVEEAIGLNYTNVTTTELLVNEMVFNFDMLKNPLTINIRPATIYVRNNATNELMNISIQINSEKYRSYGNLTFVNGEVYSMFLSETYVTDYDNPYLFLLNDSFSIAPQSGNELTLYVSGSSPLFTVSAPHNFNETRFVFVNNETIHLNSKMSHSHLNYSFTNITCENNEEIYFGETNYICEQEDPRFSAPCGGLDNGTYYFENILNSENAVDGNWNTKSSKDWDGSTDTNHTLIANYSVPDYVDSAQIKYKVDVYDESNIIYEDIPADCFAGNVLEIKYQAESSIFTTWTDEILVYCKNSSDWELISTVNHYFADDGNSRTEGIFEESVIWTFSEIDMDAVSQAEFSNLNYSTQDKCVAQFYGENIFGTVNDQEIEFYLVNATESYPEVIVQDATSTFYLNITKHDDVIVDQVILEFDGVNHTADFLTQSEQVARYKLILDVETDFEYTDSVNHQWFFNFTGKSEMSSLPSQTQTTYNVTVGECGGSNSYPIYNLSYKNDDDNEIMNMTVSYDLYFKDTGDVVHLIEGYDSINNTNFCTNLNPADEILEWDIWGSITLSKEEYMTKSYYFDEDSPVVVSNEPYTNESLFIIATNASQTVQYHWYTSSLQLIDGTMEIYKCETDGSKSLVESTGIVSGSANANIELLNQPYSYSIIYKGVTYEDDKSYGKCHTEIKNEVTYYVNIEEDISDEVGMGEITCSLKKDMDIVTMEWSPHPDEPNQYVTGCIQGYIQNIYNKTLATEACSVEEDGYILKRTIPANGNTYSLVGKLEMGNEIAYCKDYVTVGAEDINDSAFGMSGLLAVFFLVAAMILFYAGDGEIQLIGAGVGFVIAWFLGVLGTGFTVLTMTSIMAIIILVIGVGRYSRR